MDRSNINHSAPLNSRINNFFYSLDIGQLEFYKLNYIIDDIDNVYQLGPAHFIMITTEFYYYNDKYGWDQIGYQFEWLQQDLAKANENRKMRPWIIVGGHRKV